MTVIEEITVERKRQIEDEGWTPQHDDEHINGEMARAGAFYAMKGAHISLYPTFWPWDWEWFKPTTPRRNLIKAAALIVAEIERLDRESTPITSEE